MLNRRVQHRNECKIVRFVEINTKEKHSKKVGFLRSLMA